MKILVVESNLPLAIERSHFFSAHRYQTHHVSSGLSAFHWLESRLCDLIVIGKLPDITTSQLCTVVRSRGTRTPILCISDPQQISGATAHSPEALLDAGADDVVLHACPMPELMARIRALLRRPPVLASGVVHTTGRLSVNSTTGRVLKDGTEIRMQPMELSLLEFLIRHSDEVFSAHVLSERVWKGRRATTSSTVRTHIKTLRRKIDDPGMVSLITFVHGQGYQLTR